LNRARTFRLYICIYHLTPSSIWYIARIPSDVGGLTYS